MAVDDSAGVRVTEDMLVAVGVFEGVGVTEGVLVGGEGGVSVGVGDGCTTAITAEADAELLHASTACTLMSS